jgi:hypothetical protein
VPLAASLNIGWDRRHPPGGPNDYEPRGGA